MTPLLRMGDFFLSVWFSLQSSFCDFDSRSTAEIYNNLKCGCNSGNELFKSYNFKELEQFPSSIARSLLKIGTTVAWAIKSLMEHF